MFTFPLVSAVTAEIEVYDYPEVLVEGDLGTNRRSDLYRVTVHQDAVSKPAYVMFDRNQDTQGNLGLNPDHHWTNFSVSGTVEVRVERLDGQNIDQCTIYPLKKGFRAAVEGTVARFEVPEASLPLQVWVDIEGLSDNPLFVFADPIEPDPREASEGEVVVVMPGESIDAVRAKLTGSADTVVFAEGIHRWDGGTSTDYEGYRLPIESGKRIHLPGGAYVVGTFAGDSQSDWVIDGRGVLSGCGLEKLPGTPGIPYSMVYATGEEARDQRIDGIVSVCPPHFHLTVRGQVAINNVKMFGWWHSTDGTVTGDFSSVTHCFFKVMDDFIKVYADHCYHADNTLFQGVNGAPFQFSWSRQNGDHNVMVDTYLIYSVRKPLKATGNTAVINARRGGDGLVTENNFWDGLYIDNGCHRLLGLGANGGTYRHFTIKNVEIRSGKQDAPQFAESYLEDGHFEDIEFINLTVDGHAIEATDPGREDSAQGRIWMRGQTDAVTFK